MCGIMGVVGDDDAASTCYEGLRLQQPRGQHGAGIAAFQQGRIESIKNIGTVTKVFNGGTGLRKDLPGRCVVGQVRYATVGDVKNVDNLQPFVAHMCGAEIAITHNGNIPEYQEHLRILDSRRHFTTTRIDTELFMHYAMTSKEPDLTMAVLDACVKLRAAFSLIVMVNDRLMAVTDPWGIRPLCYAPRGNGFLVASESAAFATLRGVGPIEHVRPGTVVIFEEQSAPRTFRYATANARTAHCCFEPYYFARQNSEVFGMHVAAFRHRVGELLAAEDDVPADLVTAVPNTAVPMARAYAAARGIPYGDGLVLNPEHKRSFINATPEERVAEVLRKMSVHARVFRGKRVILIDDSIVRGTTSQALIAAIREVGAPEQLHMRSASPPVMRGCDLGIATFSKELIAPGKTHEQIRDYLGADSLRYLSLDSHQKLLNEFLPEGACDACFGGMHPTRGVAVERFF
jgi:amidophosphoribosyltransferase